MLSISLTLLFALISITAAVPITKELHPDAGLDIHEFTAKYGYPLESHQVQTEDGYILTLHRIPYGANDKSTPRPPVLLMHGLLSSSMDWVNMGPASALALLLADSGYDVWLGNQRGNTWSRNHVEIDPDSDPKTFYNFTWHEIGYYDLPAKIDYILETTGESSLRYIGYSQGTTTFFVMASERPEYNDKIKIMEALGPAVIMGNMPNVILRLVAENIDFFQNLTETIGMYEFLPHYEFLTDIGDYLCGNDSLLQDACVLFLNLIAGFDNKIDPDFIPVITSNTPAGAAIGQIWHYLQGYMSKVFRQYDLGTEGNMAKYGQETPPKYDLSKVTAPVILHYAKNDQLVAIEDVAILKASLPNVIDSKQVPWDQFNHLDYMWAIDIVDLLYEDIINEIY